MVAVMVMRRYGVPARTFEVMASLRGVSFDRSLVEKWQGVLMVASRVSIEGKSDADLLRLAMAMRREMFAERP
jgi:hypothetical protein